MSLARFKAAQDAAEGGFAVALQELRAGRKQSHWIWYIFPQLVGLGRSSTARLYGLTGRNEARAYLKDPELFARLNQAIETVAGQLQNGVELVDLMGSTTDALKLVSCATLFERVAEDASRGELARRCAQILSMAERQGYPRCAFTQAELES